MSATVKTLGSLGIALVGLVVYLGCFLGLSAKIAGFGAILYVGMALTVVALVTVVVFSVTGGDTTE